jgi:hypothetical protein
VVSLEQSQCALIFQFTLRIMHQSLTVMARSYSRLPVQAK